MAIDNINHIPQLKSMITGLFMGWTDPASKMWFPIKKMTWHNGKYYTVHLQGMLSAIAAKPSKGNLVKAGLVKLDRVIISSEIEVSFRTRMPVNRPFTSEWRLRRLGLPTDLTRFDPFEYVARSGGRTGGDTSDIFPEVTPDESGIYHFYFGIGDLEGIDITEYIKRLQVDDLLRIEDGLIYDENFLLGEAPGYIADIERHYPQSVKLSISKINHDIYNGGKLLCHANIDSKVTIPFSDDHYQPLVDILVAGR